MKDENITKGAEQGNVAPEGDEPWWQTKGKVGNARENNRQQ